MQGFFIYMLWCGYFLETFLSRPLTGLARSPRNLCLRWPDRLGPHPSIPLRRIRAKHPRSCQVNHLTSPGAWFGFWCRSSLCTVSHLGVSSPEERQVTEEFHLRTPQRLQSMSTGNFISIDSVRFSAQKAPDEVSTKVYCIHEVGRTEYPK